MIHFFRQSIRSNTRYFTVVSLFLFTCFIIYLFIDKGDAVFYFSDNRSLEGDTFFSYATLLGEELSYLVVIALLLFKHYRQALTVPLIGIVVTLVSFLGKELFSHDRPMLYFSKRGLFEQINVVEGIVLSGGNNSFPSGHTMSGFALFTFLALCWPQKRGMAIFFAILACLVGISRIYLVQHFLQDIIAGGTLGILIALFSYSFSERHLGKFERLNSNV